MESPSLAKQLVDAIIADFPDHTPDTRPIHTIGIGVKGHFVPSDVARNYCVAEHMRGPRVPVTVRFSNGSGSPARHDGWPDARGMATRFHLASGEATDLIAMTFGEFFTPTPETFLGFFKAAHPVPARAESPWRKLLDMLQLKQPLPDPIPGKPLSGDAGMLAYANANQFAQLAVFDSQFIGAPLSYVRASYHAVHTFVVTAPDGTRRYVRFTWQPVAGVAKTDPDAPPVDAYLKEELTARLGDWPAEFVLMMSIGESGDAFDDPTRPWPKTRRRVVMGMLTLTQIAKDQAADGEKISFNPWRLVPGIDASDDPILKVRKEAYEISRTTRGGTACPFHKG